MKSVGKLQKDGLRLHECRCWPEKRIGEPKHNDRHVGTDDIPLATTDTRPVKTNPDASNRTRSNVRFEPFPDVQGANGERKFSLKSRHCREGH